VLAQRTRISEIYRNLAQSRVIIITLGLVEAWWDGVAGMYLNVAPPKAAMKAEPDRFQLQVMSYEEIKGAMDELMGLFDDVCPADYRVVLTVSPVPLTSTFTDDDVAVANMYSKSVLRAVAEAVVRAYPQVGYYPSYESFMLTNRSDAFVSDQIHVTGEHVAFNIDRMVTAYLTGSNDDAAARAVVLRDSGNVDGARDVLTGALAESPNRIDIRTMLARLLADAGQADEAWSVISHPSADDDAAALTQRARLALLRHEPADASASTRRALALLPSFKPALVQSVMACIELGQLDEADVAVVKLEAGARTAHWKAQAAYCRSRIAEAQGDIAAAIGHMERACAFQVTQSYTANLNRLRAM